jgi:hypothetical protein
MVEVAELRTRPIVSGPKLNPRTSVLPVDTIPSSVGPTVEVEVASAAAPVTDDWNPAVPSATLEVSSLVTESL